MQSGSRQSGWERWRGAAVGLAGVCVVVLTAVVVVRATRDDVPKNFGVVEPGSVYRSGRLTPATMRYAVERLGVREFVDFGGNSDGSEAQAAMDREAARLGAKIHRLRMKGDGRGDPNRYVEALRLMRAADSSRPVLVHCAAGSERTGVCVLLYRTLVQKWDIERAYRESFEYGHSPGDNWRFMAYVAEWKDDIEEALADERVQLTNAYTAPVDPPSESN